MVQPVMVCARILIMDYIDEEQTEAEFVYDSDQIDEFETYIEETFGDFELVYHEIVSPDIHLDIIIVPPDPQENYYKLITMGAGAYEMDIPEEIQEYDLSRAEYVIYLPAQWDLENESEEAYWPIRMLKDVARLPLNTQTWLADGHTVYHSEDREPFANNTNLNSLVLLRRCDYDFTPLHFRFSSGEKINFYQLFPLYQEELDYKWDNDLEALMDLFDDVRDFPLIHPNRLNRGKRTLN
ncbi:MAG: suppressor of fused domain protein [Erysipelotrichaceae bacterium]|nr:suppressor of fused domain protein [Erysipelotrichaceae bacterium]MBE6125590.1 suppressor of fused domain protein [Erysipelotrichaceae bacterium]